MSTPAAPAPEAGAPGADVTVIAAEPAPTAPEPTGAPESPAPAPEAPAPTGGAPEAPPAPGQGTPEPTAPASEPSAGGSEGAGEATEVDQLPEWAQKHIKELREENKRSRLETKQAAVDEATKAARESFAQDIGRALGLIPTEEPGAAAEEPLTAEQLTEMLANERVSTQNAKVELAVFRAAGTHNADPSALLDSRAFLDALKNVDPSDQDSINAAIREAVANNPRLKVPEPAPAADPTPEPTPPPSGGTFAGGPSGRGNDVSTMSIDDFRKQYKDTRPGRA